MRAEYLIPGLTFLLITTVSAIPILCCTVFTVTSPDEDKVFFGSNEDWDLTLSNNYIWFFPSIGAKHGMAFVGYKYNNHEWDGFPMGGINTAGLCFDRNALALTSIKVDSSKPNWPQDPLIETLEKCSSVDEVISLFKFYRTWKLWIEQIHFADATGDAVIIGPGDESTLAFTRKGNGSYLVSTNWNVVYPEYNIADPCWRYNTATTMLDNITSKGDLTIESVQNVLNATHQEGEYVYTLYSNIYDLKNRDIYLYHYHNFEKVASMDNNQHKPIDPKVNVYL
ncbi:MAG: carcinine hydrolase/isopenicillin-N N-acyltransferase family protein, partial [Candidatus Hodarchaeota archaeon]